MALTQSIAAHAADLAGGLKGARGSLLANDVAFRGHGGHGMHGGGFGARGLGGHGFGGHGFGHHPVAAPPYHAPQGFVYQRFAYGAYLPSAFWVSDYWLTDYWLYDLGIPPDGFVWVRYGPDALLVDAHTGFVRRAIHGRFR